MASTLVHLALAGLIAVALLRDAFGVRSLAVVFGAIVLIDLDVFIGWWIIGAHRAAFHNLLLPGLLVLLLLVDTIYRDQSILREQVGSDGVRVAWVTLTAVVFAGIGPDLFTNGVNLFYPLHDQFYQLTGHIKLSTTDGIVQTFVDFSSESTDSTSSGGTNVAVGNSTEVGDRFHTGVDPQPSQTGTESEETERVFQIVNTGEQLLLVLTSAFVVGSQLIEAYRS